MSAGRADAQSITGLAVNKNAGNNADNFQDDTFSSFQRTSTVAISAQTTTSFTTRYAFVVGTDTGLFTSGSNSLASDYRINFNVTAPGAYILNVTSAARNGALTLVDDGSASATASIGPVTGASTGGTLSGSLSLPDPPDLSGNGGGNSQFNASTAATISGTSNGVAQAHQLSFSWTSSCSSGNGFTGGDECAVRGGLPITYGGETAGDYPGAGGRTQTADGHIVTVTLTSLCGNGVVDAGVGEVCDQGALNGMTGSCCAANCTIRTNGTTCRPAAGVCDVAETCDGASPNCPADGFANNTVVCRAASAGMLCDFNETCTGSGITCPPDEVQPNGFVCRAAAGDCDIAEVCNGTSTLCPMDIKSTMVCRAQNGLCDVAESCNGVSNNCPVDGFRNSAFVCRGAVDTCDQGENCPGNSANCPADLWKPNGTACPSDGNPCTVDQCSGASTACQHPAGNAGALCRSDSGTCDVAETCTGASTTCPPDGFEPVGTTCTGDGNPCTADECDGNNNCTHAAGNAGTPCRAAVDLCDVAEVCDGSSITCPADEIATNGTTCRAASPGDLCDETEVCDGSNTACPADEKQPDGTACPDAVFCNGSESCVSGVCESPGTPCGMGQSCDEGSDICFTGICPDNATVCRTAAKSILIIKDKTDNTKDKLIWKWIKGEPTSQPEFGNPTTTTSYALCFYAGPSASLIGDIAVPPDGAKWRPIGTKGYKYKDLGGTADGVTKIVLKGSTSNKSKILLKGKGTELPDFTLPFLPADLPIIVQMRNSTTGVCWESEFLTPVKNQAGLFKDKAP